MQVINHNINKTLIICIIFLCFMVLFTIALVPLYNTFCQITGLNGKIDLSKIAAAPSGIIDESRVITIEFTVTPYQKMPWGFKPQHKFIRVHPGELASTGYFANNPTNKTMISQAIPSISPFYAASYFKKVECFCFSEQVLGPGQTKNLPLRFYIDNNIPKHVKRITLAYTLFDITNGSSPVMCFDCNNQT